MYVDTNIKKTEEENKKQEKNLLIALSHMPQAIVIHGDKLSTCFNIYKKYDKSEDYYRPKA